MGTGAELIPLLLAGAGTAATAYNSYDTARRADRTAAQGIRDQAGHQRDIDQRVNQEVQAVSRSNPDDAARKSTADFLGALRRTRGAAASGGIAGGSSRYGDESGALGGQIQAYGADVADNMGQINAPQLQRQQEGVGLSRLATDIGAQARAANGDQFLNQLRQRNVRPSQGLQLFGDLAGVGAQGLAANARPAGTPAPNTPAYRRIYGARN